MVSSKSIFKSGIGKSSLNAISSTSLSILRAELALETEAESERARRAELAELALETEAESERARRAELALETEAESDRALRRAELALETEAADATDAADTEAESDRARRAELTLDTEADSDRARRAELALDTEAESDRARRAELALDTEAESDRARRAELALETEAESDRALRSELETDNSSEAEESFLRIGLMLGTSSLSSSQHIKAALLTSLTSIAPTLNGVCSISALTLPNPGILDMATSRRVASFLAAQLSIRTAIKSVPVGRPVRAP